ncbi:MAG: hypothetical protein QY322_02985 [bacterium]|nr:MAG: hypothetical protein QY322_02985 [bacterium]
MTIEFKRPQPPTKKNPLEEALLEIASDIGVPRNRWEQTWYDLAKKVGYTEDQIEAEAIRKRQEITKP